MYAIVVSPATPVKLSSVISLVTCTARPTTQPIVSDIRHAKQVLTILFVARGTLVLYSGSPPFPHGLGMRLMVVAHGILALYSGSPLSPMAWGRG